MYKFLLVLLLAFLIAPTASFAAFDDTTLTTDVTITAGGINLAVSGSSAVVESITVDTDRFFFTLLSGSSIQVTSSDKKQLTTSAPVQYITTNECGSSSSILKLSSSDSNSTIITVTPQSSTCGSNATSAAVPSSSSSSSSPGGGGSTPAGLINPTPPSTVTQNAVLPVTKIATAPAQTVAPIAISTTPAPAVSPVFTKILSPGKSSSDVKRLQQLLNTDPDTRIAGTGVGSPGNETDYFGSLTTKAIQKFQVKYGVAKSGDAGYGNLGPKTRAKLQEVFKTTSVAPALPTTPGTEQVATTPAGAVSPVFNRALSPGATHSDVKRLQQLLNTDPDTRIAEAGPGSAGNESAYFGSLTTKAIQKFQVKYQVAKPGDTGYGNLGPKTRAKLQEIFGR